MIFTRLLKAFIGIKIVGVVLAQAIYINIIPLTLSYRNVRRTLTVRITLCQAMRRMPIRAKHKRHLVKWFRVFVIWCGTMHLHLFCIRVCWRFHIRRRLDYFHNKEKILGTASENIPLFRIRTSSVQVAICMSHKHQLRSSKARRQISIIIISFCWTFVWLIFIAQLFRLIEP